jgi:glycosyltransferase involved in cell wall biosynthesis
MEKNRIYSTIIFCHKSHDGYIGGLSICDNHILEALSHCFERVIEFSFNKKPESVQGSLFSLAVKKIERITNQNDDNVYNEIVNHIRIPEETIVFFSHSTYGFLERRIRRMYPTVRISTFFHNEEFEVYLKIWRRVKNLGTTVNLLSYYVYERMVSKYSDDIIMLNKRDEKQFQKYFGKRKVCILPFTLPDRCKDIVIAQNQNRLKLLFVGTYFWGNVEGVKRFVTEVMSFIDADFYVVGNKMDLMKDEMPSMPNVHYIGRVTNEELDRYYRSSDILIAPIVEGGGMKTKVVEAIMYGCPVIGTKEAFEGFEEFLNLIGFCSDNIKDYKQYIEAYDTQRDLLYKTSIQARQVYEEHFTNAKSIDILNSLYNKY